MYILSPIANTVLRNATGYFSFHYRRYFRTPPLPCPITLSGTPPISSTMNRGRGVLTSATSTAGIFQPFRRYVTPPLYFTWQNTKANQRTIFTFQKYRYICHKCENRLTPLYNQINSLPRLILSSPSTIKKLLPMII